MFNKKLSEDDIIFNYKKLQQKYKELFYENFDKANCIIKCNTWAKR